MADSTYSPSGNNKPKSNRSFGKIMRYYFDNAMTKSGNFVLLVLIIGLISGFLLIFLQNAIYEDKGGDFFTRWWSNSTNILKIGKGDNWPDRISNFVILSLQLALASTIVGFLSSNIRELVARLKKGKSDVILKNHIVILGWSSNIFSILKQLSIANINVSKSYVVIFSNLDNEKMQEELKAIKDETKGIKIVTRCGDPSSTTDLQIVNPNEAKSIIVLNEKGEHDPEVITTVLALGTILENKKIPIVASLKNTSYADVITDLKNFSVYPVMAEEIISNVTAQACRQRGLGLVFLDLLDFDGDEIYFKKEKALVGKTYQEATVSYPKSSVIGIIKKGKVGLNPDADTIIEDGDQLIFIAEDDDKILFKAPSLESLSALKTPEYTPVSSNRSILFVGWSKTGNVILDSLIPTLSQDSTITIAYQESFTDENTIPDKEGITGVNFDIIEVGSDFNNISDILDGNTFDEVMIIGYAEKLSVEEADTTTLMYMLQLDSYLNRHTDKSFRVVAQVLDSSKAKLAQFTKTDELIISDNLSGLLMAQLSENPKLDIVFDHLFDQSKSNINIYPISKYVELGKKVTYEELTYAATLYNESAIGYRRDRKDTSSHAEGLQLNPAKSTAFEANETDFLVVVDHDHA